MKSFGLILCVFLFVSCDSEKDIRASKVPSLVLNSLEIEFPAARDVEWETKNGNYFVDFEVDGIDYNAKLNLKGKLLKYKYNLLRTELPELVWQTVRAYYKDKRVDGVEILKIGKSTYYQVEFEGIFFDSHKIFDKKGNEVPNIDNWD